MKRSSRKIGRRRAAVWAIAASIAGMLLAASWATPPSVRISHAGGGLPAGPMSNSLEAFDRAYQRGFRLIEADFEITPDGAIVLLHDWQGAYRYWFGRTEPLPHAEFMAARMRGGLTPMDFQALLAWLERHPDARVITDVKRDNLRVLAGLAQTERRHQFIPQVYSEQEIAPVRAMGFRDVIFTNYRAKLGRDELRRLDPALYAVTVPWREAADLDRRVFVHTVNSRPLHTWLVLRGIDGIYTDTLAP